MRHICFVSFCRQLIFALPALQEFVIRAAMAFAQGEKSRAECRPRFAGKTRAVRAKRTDARNEELSLFVMKSLPREVVAKCSRAPE